MKFYGISLLHLIIFNPQSNFEIKFNVNHKKKNHININVYLLNKTLPFVYTEIFSIKL